MAGCRKRRRISYRKQPTMRLNGADTLTRARLTAVCSEQATIAIGVEAAATGSPLSREHADEKGQPVGVGLRRDHVEAYTQVRADQTIEKSDGSSHKATISKRGAGPIRLRIWGVKKFPRTKPRTNRVFDGVTAARLAGN